MKRILAIVLSLAAILTVFAGCGSSTSSGTKGISASIASEPASIDPSLNKSLDGGTYINCAFEGLTTYDKEGKIVPGTAEKWDISADNKVYTFHIRKDAKWSDGKAVTANDFVYSWKRAVDPKTASDYAYYLYFVKNGEAINTNGADINTLGVKAIDDTTLEVTLENVCPFFTEIVAFPTLVPLREDIVSKNPDKWTLDPKTYIGNGPYVLKEWKHSSKLVFEKNDNYWDKNNIVAPKIEWLLMNDPNAILGAFKNKQLSFARNIPHDEIPAEKEAGNLHLFPQLGTYYLDLLNTKAPFDNPKVRKAVSLAIDRNYITEKVRKAGETPASGFIPYGIADVSQDPDFRTKGGDFYSVKPEDYEKNVAEAKKLLAEAGYPDGKGFPKVTFGLNTGSGHEAVAEAIQQQLKTNLGIEVEIQAQEWNVFQESRKNGLFDIARDGWVGDYMDPSTFMDLLTSNNPQNNSKYKNAAYDKAIADAKKETDSAKRVQLYHDAEKFLMDETGVVPLFFYTDPIIVDKNLQGYVVTKLGFVYLNWASFK
ncbi:peptide ABC transporter substrate-binding protein [Ruminiclostridium josui]|uniref:peptide ABC transporter substrate-binding protein n=1 Tax=Ruminiclostridium josui TaxID=1499 RepID=UPI00046343D6|nr:peptide ABC transporter substrate-binding protein [Ruminiclostridium josui]